MPQIRAIARQSKATVLRWLKRYVAEGPDGLRGVPLSGCLSEVARVYRAMPIAAVRLRPPNAGCRFS